MDSRPVYQSSGQVGRGLVAMLPVSLLAGAVTGFVYGYSCFYCIDWIGSQKISALLAMAFFMGLGAAVYKLAIFAKCRSGILVGLTGFLSGTVALYVAWSVFSSVLLERQYSTNVSALDIMRDPSQLWDFIQAVAENGWYTTSYGSSSGSGSTDKGAFLWITWGVEALVATAGPAFMAVSLWRGQVFCESCGFWCQDGATATRMAGSDPTLEARLKTGDLNALTGLAAAQAAKPMYKVDQKLCKACGNTGTYKITKITPGSGKKNETKTEDLTPLYMLDAEAASAMGSLLGAGPAPGTAPVPPAPPA